MSREKIITAIFILIGLSRNSAPRGDSSRKETDIETMISRAKSLAIAVPSSELLRLRDQQMELVNFSGG